MGCDIHLYSEKWDEHTKKWETFDLWEKNEYYSKPSPDATQEEIEEAEWEGEWVVSEIDDARWYEKFGILSPGVRCEPEGPTARERGWPHDACKEYDEMYIRWDCDAHSPNWITITEFRHLVAQYRVLRGSDSPLANMHQAVEAHIKRKLKWDHVIQRQNMDHIRLVYWFDN